MNTAEINIDQTVNDPLSHFRTFDETSFNSFKSVWQTRLIEARDIHKRDDLIQKAEAILNFISDSTSELRLYIISDKRVSFLYQTSSKRYLMI